MTPAEYGFAVGAGLQQGFSNVIVGLREGRAAQEQSLRERAFVAELEQNERLFPLKVAQIENQTQAVKLQSEMQQYNLNLQRAQMGMMSAMAPIDTEMAFLAEANPNALASYQIPDIKVDHPDPTFAKYASDLARQKLLEKKTSLLEATEDFQDRKAVADTMFQASRIPGLQAPLRSLSRGIARKIRTGGIESLTPEEQGFVTKFSDMVYKRSERYREAVKEERELGLKEKGEETKRLGALGKISEGLFTPTKTREAAEKGISQILGGAGGVSALTPQETTEKIANQEIDLEPVKLKFKQGAEAVRRGADATEVIDRLATEILKVSGKADNPKNRMAARNYVADKLQLGGLDIPMFAPQDFGDSQEQE